MRQVVTAVVLTAAVLVSTTGCRSVGDVMGFEGAGGIDEVVWSTPMEDIDPPAPDRRKIYVTYRDMSGEGIELKEPIRELVRGQGWDLTSNPDEADYHLRATLRFFGRNPANDHGVSMVSRCGPIIGAGYGYQDPANNYVSGAAQTGIDTDGVFGTTMANYSTSREWDMVVDVVLAQRFDGGVVTDWSGRSGRQQETATGIGTGGGVNTGGQQDTVERTQSVQQIKDHMLFPGRLVGWMSQWTLEGDEAREVLEPKLLKALANAVPSAS